MLGLTVPTEMAAKAKALRQFGYKLKAKEDNSVRMALNFEVREKLKKKCPRAHERKSY